MIDDTHDERYRQKLARRLVEGCGFAKEEITPRYRYRFAIEDRCAEIGVDFVITLAERICMAVKYAPGSLVTRHQPALAAARVLAPYQIPVVVVTNGENADVLHGDTGRVVATGLDGIPSRTALADLAARSGVDPIDPQRIIMAHRILYAFEIHGSCNCDADACDGAKGS
ncbi:MAG: type I restriction enzyme HsdR N-terminal domain-containing protein [Desulfobacterales bacterium]|nr:type I restriction enzyme HsdR N-terminal domain-containing protein [Desulfobacterales bacterium]